MEVLFRSDFAIALLRLLILKHDNLITNGLRIRPILPHLNDFESLHHLLLDAVHWCSVQQDRLVHTDHLDNHLKILRRRLLFHHLLPHDLRVPLRCRRMPRHLVPLQAFSTGKLGRTVGTTKGLLIGVRSLVLGTVRTLHERPLAKTTLKPAIVLVHVYVHLQLLPAGKLLRALGAFVPAWQSSTFVDLANVLHEARVRRPTPKTKLALELLVVCALVVMQRGRVSRTVFTTLDVAKVPFVRIARFPRWSPVARVVREVSCHVVAQVGRVKKLLVALATAIAPFVDVFPLVDQEVVPVVEPLPAPVTFERFFPGVNPLVPSQQRAVVKRFSAVRTLERFLLLGPVVGHVYPEMSTQLEELPTNLAGVPVGAGFRVHVVSVKLAGLFSLKAQRTAAALERVLVRAQMPVQLGQRFGHLWAVRRGALLAPVR